MNREEVLLVFEKYFNESIENYVSEERLFEKPIISIGSADDPMWETLKETQSVGKLFKTPKEWMPEAKTVISYFAPFSDYVVNSNKEDPSEVGIGWLYARIEGQKFLSAANHFMEKYFADNGIKAFAPFSSEEFKSSFIPESVSFTSNWSERHVGYVCGLGTFGLSKGLITEKGVAGRLGSIIVDFPFETDMRKYKGLYDYCSMCGKCAINCPAGAISIENGKKHVPCMNYLQTVKEKYMPRYGCGKCQVNTPCERAIPVRASFVG